MNVGVVGSKEFRHRGLVESPVYELTPDDTVVTGVAPGVDEAAREAARRAACDLNVIEPGEGQSQGEHHQEKLDASDRVVIFWNGESEGTRDLIERALDMGLEAEITVMP